jgi:Leucine-rich repeat (LRR) protein
MSAPRGDEPAEPPPDDVPAADVPKSLNLLPPIANPLIHRLQDLCLMTIVQNFDECSQLHLVPRKYRAYILQNLPTTLPLPLAVMTIPDGLYWKRRTFQTFPRIPHDPSWKVWKRFFLENYASKRLEDATEANVDDVFNELRVIGPFIRQIKLTRSPCKVSMLKFFRTFRGLTSLSLVYGEPRRSFAQYEEFDNFDVRAENSATLRDCQVMCQDFLALGRYCSLQEFDMSDNSLNDQSFLRVAKGLFQALVSLTSLTFAHNEIGDEGAKAIASCLLNSPVRLIDLSDNRIGPSGTERICECAMQHDALEELNLSSNQLEDEGLEYVVRYLEKTKSLRNLNIAGKGIAHFAQLCDALTKNASLRLLNVAANPIVDEDYAALQTVSGQSQTLDRIDMRVYELKPEDFDVSTTETSEAPLLRFK